MPEILLNDALKLDRGLSIPGLAVRGGGQMSWARDAYHAWDFLNDQARFAGVYKGPLANTPNWSYTRSQTPTAYAQNAAGVLIPFATGVLRRTDKGVLIEGARTNLCIRSQELDNAAWSKTRSSVSADALAAPDGTSTADKIVEDSSNNTHWLISTAATITADATFVVSGYFKAGERSWARLTGTDGTETNHFGAYFNLGSGVAGSNQVGGTGSVTAKGITALAGGWYFCWVVGVVASGVTSVRVQVKLASADNTQSYQGDDASGVYAWGVQLEQASFPSSYIPTTTASASRAADALTVTSPGVDYPLTLFAEFERAVDTGTNEGLLEVNNGTSSDRALLTMSTSDLVQMYSRASSVDQTSTTIAGALSLNTTYRTAARFATNDARHARSGTLGTQDTSCTNPATPAKIVFGDQNAGNSQLFGYLRRCAIWNRALSDAELQSVTT